jgi:anhydro-N-acetylmuramic acid kinase
MAKERVFIGLYTGAAADGIDAAVVTVKGRGEAMSVAGAHHVEKMYPQTLRQRIQAFAGGHTAASQTGHPAAESFKALAELDRDIGIAAAATGKALIAHAGLKADDIEAVGWSSQLISLVPPGASNQIGAVLEAGSAAIIAERLARPVVSGFSASDVAAGGLGGPITAWCDWLLLRDERLSRVTVHLGGIASLTFIPAGADPADVVAFDTGPGTMVVDELVYKFHHRMYDTDGSIAAGGRVDPVLLNELQAGTYFQQGPPKRTTPGEWSQKYLWRVLQMAQKHNCQGADLIATVTELTARSIAQGIADLTERPHEIILTGGGAMNIHLAGRIRQLLSPSSTYTVEKYGFVICAKQAACYAILAAARLDAVAAHCPAATGAKHPAVLGAVTL